MEIYDDDDNDLQKIFLDDLSQKISGGQAKLVKDDRQQIKVIYSDSEKSYYDLSQSGKIVAPRSKPKEVIESCLDVINMIKKERAPDGVLLDKTKISITQRGTYKEGENYEILDRVLGKGLNGQIVAVRDKKNESDHALKTMMLALFVENEIRCWTDLEGHDNFPALYMFNRENDEIHYHFQILEKAITITDIVDKHMEKLRGNLKLLRHFSLYVLQGLLEASSKMHSKNWLHDDLHESNAMIQPMPEDDVKFKVRVLDFGKAKKLEGTQTITKDMQEIIRVFTSVYVTQNFQDATDLKRNWEEKLTAQADLYELSEDDKNELLNLVKLALDVHQKEEEIRLKEEVDYKLKNSLANNPEIMQSIFELLFPGRDVVDDVSTAAFPFEDIFKIESGCTGMTLN